MTGPELLVLWDIDNTLISARGFGKLMYRQAFLDAFGRELTGSLDLGGRTELDVIGEILRQHDIEHTEEASQLLATALANSFESRRGDLPGHAEVLPGALRALRHFADDPRVHQGVLTANLASVARIKLEAFGLAHLVDWDVSAFGDDHADRAELVTFARSRARHLRPFTDDEVVLIGDTPHDVHAAVTSGVRLVAVATGRSSADDLRLAGATVVLPDLSDLDELTRQVWRNAPQGNRTA
ncbi:phosphoglycolate phosphatase-like HAD superfamily hydrolase [Lentzea atacamensis]|uniref:Phosphoglycolate phosphatase-like HAD superfamily hydrolase n=1 Tax=Lentzea atacamensis TaxID=531938 RepID=A0ABX9EC24_9PSEU|nr:haloacid dehalogenase-like hydrolase [Lentzea atacamensis]RAS66204.1 phosphoglycolate phosphatase-like HAD superfamily hydrolase [Lentzea atacamensis]